MREDITADKAVKKGQWMVNGPVFVVMLVIIGLSIYLALNDYIPKCTIPIGIGVGILASWLIWSFMITKWRIWAFTNVQNVHELKEKAIRSNLIWKDGSFFEKTEIRSALQKQQLSELEKKFAKKDVYEDDLLVRDETLIYLSKIEIFIEGFMGFVILFVGPKLLFNGDNIMIKVLGAGMLLFAFYSVYSAFKKFSNYKPQIILNSKELFIEGIGSYKWSAVHNEKMTHSGSGKHRKYFIAFHYYELNAETLEDEIVMREFDLDGISMSPNKIEDLLRIYRLRFNKKNK